jgi:hypothetical protein
VWRGRHTVEITAIITIAIHARASQKAASEGIDTVLVHARSVPGPRGVQASVWRNHSATVSVIFARGPAGAKSWSPPSIVTIRFGTRACESTAA